MDLGFELLGKYLHALSDCHSVEFPEFPTVELTDEDELGRRGKIFRHEQSGPGDSWLLEASADSCRFSVKFFQPKSCLSEMLRRLAASCRIRAMRRTPLKGYHLTFLFLASETVAPAAEAAQAAALLEKIREVSEKVDRESQGFIRGRVVF